MQPIVTEDDLSLQCIYRWERERAHQVFLTQPFGGGRVRTWTWSETVDEARRMASYLKSQGWEPGSRVAILSRNCAWWILADLAIWMAGYVSVPIYPSLRAESVRQILEHSGARAGFIGATDDRELATQGVPEDLCSIFFPTAPPGNHPLWPDIVAAYSPVPGTPTRPGDDLATIIYTSGTTGRPKGVMHRFSSFAFNAKALSRLLGLTSEQRVLSYLPLAHIVERAGMEAVSLYLGSQIFFAEGLETFVADLHRARPTIFLSVPRLLLKFQQGVLAKLPSWKLDLLLRIPIVAGLVKRKILYQLGLDTVSQAACGSAPLPTEILLWFRRLGLNLVEGYGMTETMITHLPGPGRPRPGYVGPSLEGVETRIAGDGELQVGSPMNMIGYYRDPAATSAAFTPDGFFRTGDLGVIEPDGQLRIVGRLKEQFKTSKGKYVAPAPIESRLAAHPAVDACCLMGAGQPVPFAIVLLSDEARQRSRDTAAREALERSLQAQMQEVNARLDPHERVSLIAIVDGPWSVENGLMTPTLKVKRGVLESRYQALVGEWVKLGRPVVWESAP
jgi:long-chain acyl-CoA synthetase